MSETLTWLVVVKFEGPSDLNDDQLMNKFADAIAQAGGENDDEIIGNLSGSVNGSLDDAFDAARGYLSAAVKR